MSRTLKPSSIITNMSPPRAAGGQWARAIAVGIIAATAVPADSGAAGQPPQAVGLWYDDTGKGAVEILPCGQALCGRIVWLREPLSSAGKPLTDKLNPEPSKRTQPICGLQVLGGLQPQDDGTWDAGWVYDPKEGKSYDAAVQVEGPSRLAVTGYLGVKFLGRTLSWTKAPPDLPRCAT